MQHLATVLLPRVPGRGPGRGGLVSDVREELTAQCINANAPRSYWDSQIVDIFAITTACQRWAHKQVAHAR